MTKTTRSAGPSVGMVVAGFAAMGLSAVLLLDDYKGWMFDLFPLLREWAYQGCNIGRPEALQSIPALLLVYTGVAAFHYARRSVAQQKWPYRIATVLVWLANTIAVAATLFWLIAITLGLPGSCS